MISERRKAWLKDKLHGFLLRKLPNLARLLDLFEKPLREQRHHLLDEHFQDGINVLKKKAFPYLLAYLAGCFAPAQYRRLNHKRARTS